jgi:hypothetical protein
MTFSNREFPIRYLIIFILIYANILAVWGDSMSPLPFKLAVKEIIVLLSVFESYVLKS